MKYEAAFTRHDGERRKEYIINVLEKDGKLNINGVMPYEVVHRYMKGSWYISGTQEDILAEALWKKMSAEGFDNKWGFDDCIVVADTSGSMTDNASGSSSVTAMEVCYSLAIFFAEKLRGEFCNKVVSFSERPKFIDLAKGTNLKEKLEVMCAHSEVANTNVEAVFDLLLNLAISKSVPKDELPKQVLLISDMEFDSAIDKKVDEKLFDAINKKYTEAGYSMPRLIFWNVCGRTDTIPMVNNEEGLCLLSGFSQNAMKIAAAKDADGKTIRDPYESLVQVLNSERYAAVAEAVSKSLTA